MTSWSIYHGINKQTRVMNNLMSRTMLFFRYLRGPKMHLWIKKISTQLYHHLHTGGRDTDCQGLAGPWYAQHERGAVKARFSEFRDAMTVDEGASPS